MLPTYIFLTPGGREVGRLPELKTVLPSPSKFVEMLDRTLAETQRESRKFSGGMNSRDLTAD